MKHILCWHFLPSGYSIWHCWLNDSMFYLSASEEAHEMEFKDEGFIWV